MPDDLGAPHRLDRAPDARRQPTEATVSSRSPGAHGAIPTPPTPNQRPALRPLTVGSRPGSSCAISGGCGHSCYPVSLSHQCYQRASTADAPCRLLTVDTSRT
jgi:hypothetical protein